ncbi:MAG: DUF5615 family PIN-like protein [Anaerolineae bacterium]|nr:DUF5615 family PIN-like protein [Anaerolineae bacterium]
MARFLADENFPDPACEILAQLGHDVLTWAQTGQANLSIDDASVLALAAQTNRVLLTLNRKHFKELHRINPIRAGIVVCTVDLDFPRLARRIHEVITSEPDSAGRLFSVTRPGS